MRSFLLVVLAAGASHAAFADNWSKHWSVSSHPELRVETGYGRVEINPGAGNQIEATVTTNGWRIAPDEVTIVERQDGDRVELEVRVPKKHFNMGWHGSREIRVQLRVPPETRSFIHTGDGAIQISGLRGRTEARTGDGGIEALDMEGAFEAHSGDGHIHVRGRLDNLDIETGDGSIEAELVRGSRVSSAWRLHTGDGHVTMRVPDDLHVNLDAHTGDGSISVDLPITMEGVFKNRNEVRGRINGGGEVLTIRTGDGPIRIERS